MASTDDPTRAELLALELALAQRRFDLLPGGLAAVLDGDFVEIGASGRRWTRDDVLAQLASTAPNDAVSIEDFLIAALAPDVVLATFDAVRTDGARTRRSSIWVRRDGRWVVRFHQGTPA